MKIGTKVKYMDPTDPYDWAHYPDFLGVGEVVGDSWRGHRPIIVLFENCKDGKMRRRSFSPKNLVVV